MTPVRKFHGDGGHGGSGISNMTDERNFTEVGTSSNQPVFIGVPNGIRTPVIAVKGLTRQFWTPLLGSRSLPRFE